jgi:hypothetical protein
MPEALLAGKTEEAFTKNRGAECQAERREYEYERNVGLAL